MFNWNRLTICLIALGGVLLLSSAAWFQFVDSRSYWSDEEALAMASAGEEHHTAMHHAAHHTMDEHVAHNGVEEEADQHDDEARHKIETQLQQSQQAFEAAKARYALPPRVMRYSGMACLVLGIFTYFMARSADG